MKEEYRDIKGYEGLYQVSNLGNVKSLKFGKEKILIPTKKSCGYLIVGLFKQGKRKFCLVHRLVAEAFIENTNKLPQVNHKDENKTNNQFTNLEWCDNKYNINYGTRTEKTTKQVMCVETGVVYPSAKEVERQLGFAQSNISNACNGKIKTCGGYTWKYVS